MAFNQVQMGNLQSAHANYLLFASGPTITLDGSKAQGAIAQQQSSLGQPGGAQVAQATSAPIQTASQSSQVSLESIAAKVIPTGVPKIYGAELGVTFADPVNSMAVLAKMDDGNGMPDKTMNARYVKIGSQIACEYCCGANTLVFETGQAACGCAHSYAMRGLAKYLISKHGAEYTDEQILEELGKWKTMFFPKPILTKAVEFATAGKDINTLDLTTNKFRGFKAPAAAPATSGSSGVANIANLPNMVGG